MVKKSLQTPCCFGARLRQARERAGLAQDKLGVLIGLDEGCSSARISRYETGVHEPPFETARKLAQVLGVSVTYFYCEDDWLADLVLRLTVLTPAQRVELAAWLDRQRGGI
ncbi:helix-turn-helix domain-containing protein [Candidatus Thiodictyon syntrophicum]|jgi:transcriptional regulator with XRE-family HTH domain|uniref:XRE family transcriptional regulator n=1 Tax=Candidatus Thiodictyon syntrophicum TaxID=1166950 RepID=A0A2K8U4L1_9GAMM|nr:helix-turn-helix transcriptional regulator [Candidatus Thiodictyon syntrophicum]AUB80487.1 XRE family transcriptional regulator [Candidatus Thiodictyon syntrophicum]